VTLTTFQELLLTPFTLHEILEFEILSSGKHFCHEEISEIWFRAEVWTRAILIFPKWNAQISSNLFPFKTNLPLFMCVLFYSSFVRISAYANVYFKTTIIKQNIKTILFVRGPLREYRSIRSGASGLPYYRDCASLVRISVVIELLAVWWHNKSKPKSDSRSSIDSRLRKIVFKQVNWTMTCISNMWTNTHTQINKYDYLCTKKINYCSSDTLHTWGML